ncbi:hypothetical protein RND81_01G199100 [Saponaria officinalis]|uniref:F-box domain-containing protein n=1 Tax=Saponaria officinalis TaxID=3572 RepID=A0AAW1NG60_SAPOF
MDVVDRDLWNSLHPDVAGKILKCLDDPGDIVRASSVSRAWREFVISNGVSKHLCLRLFPQLSSITRVVDTGNKQQHKCSDVGCSRCAELEQLKLEHRVFASLYRGLTSSEVVECLLDALGASSTDNYPKESVDNTLEPRDRIGRMASYWSSSGQSNPDVSERLTYELVPESWVITEINIQPFQAFFQAHSPIYSAKAVRFRMGYRKWRDYDEILKEEEEDGDFSNSCRGLPFDDEDFVWTYTSKEFPMAQENRLQNFKLPEPVLFTGGFVQIELLGRVQRQELDGLFYIRVAYVQIIGRPLALVFHITPLEPSGTYSMMFNPAADYWRPRDYPYELTHNPRHGANA